MSAGIPRDHSYYELYQQCLLERNDLKAKLAEAEAALAGRPADVASGWRTERDVARAEVARLREALEAAVEYLEPRLAGKEGSRGLTIVLPALREALGPKEEPGGAK